MEGPKLPTTRPTLAATHPELGTQGEIILQAIADTLEQGPEAVDFLEKLPKIFDSVAEFVIAVLAVRGPYDEVAHWVEQTYKAVQRLEKTPPASQRSYEPEKPSWAAVAAHRPVDRIQEEVALRRVKIRIADSAEKTALWKEANNAILGRIARTAVGAGVVGVRKLPSGDIVVQTKEQEGKTVLSRGKAWVESIAPSARAIPDMFPVMVNGVRLQNVDTTKQKEAIKLLEEQNQKLHPGLAILRVTWPRGVLRTEKRFSSLTVFVGTPERANQLIQKGFVEGGEVKDTVRYVTGCGLVQCFKCCRYGHIAKHCRLEASCGRCSKDHETRNCPKGIMNYAYCTNCKTRPSYEGPKTHYAWDETCAVRMAQRHNLRQKLLNSPFFYLEHSLAAGSTQGALGVHEPSPTAEKKKPGRPVGSKNKGKATDLGEGQSRLDEMDVDQLDRTGSKRKRQLTLVAALTQGQGGGEQARTMED